MNTVVETVAPPIAESISREHAPSAPRFKYYTQFIYRYAFAYLLFLYMRYQGLVQGPVQPHHIAAAMLVYVCAVAFVMFQAGGARLTPLLQRCLVGLDLCAVVIGVPYDPNPGFPTLFVFYLAYADLGLRYRYKLYIEALYMGAVALVMVLLIRWQFTDIGLGMLDIWQVALLTVIVLHGLQVFSGRDRARRMLQESQERLQLALLTPGVGAWATSNPLDELQIDGHMREVLGLAPVQASDRMSDYIARIHPEDRDRVVAHYFSFVRSAATDYEDQYRIVRSDGSLLTLVSRAQAVRETGRALQIYGMVWDITEQKQQQEALLRMEERYRLATHSARVGVWVWHVREDRFEHDDALNLLLNIPEGGRADRLDDVLQVIHPEDRERFRAHLHSAVASDATEYFDEVRVHPSDGPVQVLQSRAVIYRDDSGQAIRLAGANWDATRLAEARKELEDKTRALEVTNRELDDFSYIASHDLKEPLRGITNYTQFLRQDYADKLDDEGRSMLERVGEQAARMTTLINELLNIARLGRIQLEVHETDLNVVVREILSSLEFTLAEKNVDVRMPQPLPTSTCDRVRVGELYRNLITNAVKYNDNQARCVELGWSSKATGNEFYVRDNGIGIKPEHRAQVFTLFERLHKRDAYGGGTGVGLTIAEKIVQMHGGRIWLESEPGKGTTFYFTLAPARIL